MTRTIKTLAAALVTALLLGTSLAAAQSVKVGYVNLGRIEKEAAIARRSSETLKQEFEPRNQQVQELQKRIEAARQRFDQERDKLGPADAQARGREISDMMRQSDQMVMRLAEEFEQRKGELGARLIEETRQAIQTVAEAGKFDLILQEAAFARSGVDVTNQVLKEMERRAGAAAR
jgi:outer membrane protein